MYKLQDISIVIATYNRAGDLKITLGSIMPFLKDISEVLIVDQSPNEETKVLIKKLNKKNIKYIYSSTPSLTHARNLGVSKVSPTSKIICFLDDDVTLGKNYFKEILKVFNNNPSALGVSAYQKQNESGLFGKIQNFVKRFFLIENLKRNSARVLSTYGNEYPSELDNIINSQWLTGFNMNYKIEVFKKEKFDENLKRYALAEDFDFSYRVNKRYPKSLFITPFAKINHRASIIERYPTKKISYMNQINHFYLNYKNFNKGLPEKLKFIWCLLGITSLRLLNALFGFKKEKGLKLFYFISSITYCIKHLDKIKKAELDKEI
jgi:GT2 family glycosyltransferase